LHTSLDAFAILLATIIIFLFIARQPHCHQHCPLCRGYCCLPATLIAVAIALVIAITKATMCTDMQKKQDSDNIADNGIFGTLPER
jgi:hypothetical protein